MKNLLIFSLFLAFIFGEVKAQDEPGERKLFGSLKIGDKCPDVVLTNFLNYPAPFIKLSDLKGKFVIFDYWNIYCAPCIRSFPKMEDLVDKFNGKLVVIAVTRNSRKDIDELKTRSAIARETRLPIIYSDTTLFSPLEQPQHIWIDENGKLLYRADISNATEKSIAEVLDHKELFFNDVNEFQEMDNSQPLFLRDNARFAKNLQQYSYLMNRVDGMGGAYYGYDSITARQVSYSAMNANRLSLIQDAYRTENFEPGNSNDLRRIVLEVKDTSLYFNPFSPFNTASIQAYEAWENRNSFCYGLKVDPSLGGKFYHFMQQDLNRLFNIETSVERRRVRCWVLIRTSDRDKLKTKARRSFYKVPVVNDTLLALRMAETGELAKWILHDKDKSFIHDIVIDETNYKGLIDVDLNLIDLMSIATAKKALKKYDLDLKRKEMWLDFIVIRDRK